MTDTQTDELIDMGFSSPKSGHYVTLLFPTLEGFEAFKRMAGRIIDRDRLEEAREALRGDVLFGGLPGHSRQGTGSIPAPSAHKVTR